MEITKPDFGLESRRYLPLTEHPEQLGRLIFSDIFSAWQNIANCYIR